MMMHRFSSPEWLDFLRRHILVPDEEGGRSNIVSLLREIMRLETSEVQVFAPSAVLGVNDEIGRQRSDADEFLNMRMRNRITWSGGGPWFVSDT